MIKMMFGLMTGKGLFFPKLFPDTRAITAIDVMEIEKP